MIFDSSSIILWNNVYGSSHVHKFCTFPKCTGKLLLHTYYTLNICETLKPVF